MIHTTIVKCLQESIAFEGYLNSYSTWYKFTVEDGIYINNMKYGKNPLWSIKKSVSEINCPQIRSFSLLEKSAWKAIHISVEERFCCL